MSIQNYIQRTDEIDELQKKSEHVKNLDRSISWEPTFETCAFELKTSELMNKADATSLLTKIKSLEKPINHKAYAVMESRTTRGTWRIIVALEIYTLDSDQ